MTGIVFIEQAPDAGAEHELEDGATIGREGCDVTLSDGDVSRSHATVRSDGTSISIEDLGSTNGTFVNDRRIDAVTALRDGDRVRFGAVVWQLRMPIQATRQVPTVPPAQPTRAVPTRPPESPDPAQTAASPVRPAEPTEAEAAPPAPEPPEATAARPAVDRTRSESRGDVPMPSPPPPAPPVVAASGETPAFSPSGGRFKRSAARRAEATVISYGVVIATAVAVGAYFAQR